MFDINAGIPQGSIPGLTLFLPCINYLPGRIFQDINIYSDDKTLYAGVDYKADDFEVLEYAADFRRMLHLLLNGVRSGWFLSIPKNTVGFF